MKSSIFVHYILAFKTIYTASSLSSCIILNLCCNIDDCILFFFVSYCKLIGDVFVFKSGFE